MKKWIVIIFFLLTTASYAQQPYGAFVDYGSNFADGIYTDTSRFSYPDVLGASDYTVQRALQTLDQRLGASGPTIIVNCQTSDSYCYQYTPTTLTLWMSSNRVHDWTITLADEFLLLESGDFLLLESGDKLVLE